MAATASRTKYEKSIGRHPEWPRLISEGDSWLSYPFSRNLVSTLASIDTHINLLRVEHSGDDMLDIIADRETGDALDQGAIDQRFGGYQEQRLRGLLSRPLDRPQVLLFSAGGNDVIGPEMASYLRPYADYRADVPVGQDDPAKAVVDVALRKTLGRLESAYRRLIALRDGAAGAAACLILTHSYCAPQPRNVEGRFGVGPWMYPAFQRRGYPDGESKLMLDVVRWMLKQFKTLLDSIAADPAVQNFRVVDIQRPAHALTPAPFDGKAASGDWQDEVHPSSAGFEKLAQAFRPALRAVFPNSKF